MRIKSIFSRTKITIVLLFASLIMIVGAIFAVKAVAETDTQLPSKVYIGEVIEIPQKTITYNGQSEKAEIYIRKPQGGLFKGKAITIDQFGVYTIEYRATIAGEEIVETETFTCARTPKDMFVTTKYATASNGEHSLNPDVYSGVVLTARTGEVVSFDKTIDMTGYTKNDVFAELLVDSFKQGEADFSELFMYITDADNPDNVLTISFRDSTLVNCGGKGTYIKAAATGQDLTGVNMGNVVTYYEFGTEIKHSFWGLSNSETLQSIKLFYDDEEKAIYVSTPWDYRAPSKVVIADFNDTSHFPSVQWDGFTNGRAKISFGVAGVVNTEARFLLTELADFNFNSDELIDILAPEIRIDSKGESSMPPAVLGADYTLFEAEVIDNYDERLPLQKSVSWLDNKTGKYVDIPVENGKFHVGYVGTYRIEYYAVDSYGNEAREEFFVYASVKETPIDIDIVEPQTMAVAGEQAAIAQVSASGGSGNLSIITQVYDPEGDEIEFKDGTFAPMKVGAYTVKYIAKDYLGFEGANSYMLNVVAPEKPIYEELPFFPEVFIKGFTYVLPDVSVKEFIGETNPVDVNVVKKVNGEIVDATSFKASGESITITYEAVGQSGKNIYSITCPVVDVKNGQEQPAYFYGENFTVDYQREAVRFILDEAKDTSILYAKELSVKKFYIKLGVYDKTNAMDRFDGFTITLTDAKNSDIRVSLVVKRVGENVSLTLPYGSETKIDGSFVLPEKEIALRYNETDHSLRDATNASCGIIKYCDNGDVFTGFSDTVFLTITFDGVKGSSALSLIELNNQPMGYRRSKIELSADRIAPEIFIDTDYTRSYKLNSVIPVSSARAYDVLNEIYSVQVTVTAPDGTRIIDKASASKEYQFTANQYGTYKISYEAKDGASNTAKVQTLCQVIEQEPPKVETSGLKQTYKVGDTINIPQATISDNSGEYEYSVMLINANNYMEMLIYKGRYDFNDSSSFTVKEAGTYTLRYFVYDYTSESDLSFNYTMVDFTFTVS